MHVEQRVWEGGTWSVTRAPEPGVEPQLALVFGPLAQVSDPALWTDLHAIYPRARLVACSTAGEIAGARVLDQAVVVTGVTLEHGALAAASVELDETGDSSALGHVLAGRLPRPGLTHVLVLLDGARIDRRRFLDGFTADLAPQVTVTCGRSVDGAPCPGTAVCLDGPEPTAQVVAIGFYGDRVLVGSRSLGGPSLLGPDDDDPALALLIGDLGYERALPGRIADEVAAISESVGPGTVVAGFWSFGELDPRATTVTTISER